MKIDVKIATYTLPMEDVMRHVAKSKLEVKEFGSTRYHYVITDKAIYRSNYLELSDEVEVLTNNVEFKKHTPKFQDTVSIETKNEIEQIEVPSFGVTIDNNFSIHQFMISKKDYDKMSPPTYWVDSEHLLVGNMLISKEEIEKTITDYLENKKINILTLHLESNQMPLLNAGLTCLFENANIDSVPIRLLTYKDITYVKNMFPTYYAYICEIPKNKNYVRLEEQDYSFKFLVEDEAKENICKKQKENFESFAYDKNAIRYYYFIQEDSEEDAKLNKEFLDYIKNSKIIYNPNTQINDGAYSSFLYQYLKGKQEESERQSIYPNDTADNFVKSKNKYTFDAVSKEIIALAYNKATDNNQSIFDKKQAIIVENARRTAYVNIEDIHMHLDKNILVYQKR